jgi:hypothetical protein
MEDEVVVKLSKADAVATKAAQKQKPANASKDVDAKAKPKVDAEVIKNDVKAAVPKPAGAEIKKDLKSDVKTATKPATKAVVVRKGGGGGV